MAKTKLSKDALEFFRKAGQRGGKIGGAKGGVAVAKKMTAEERQERPVWPRRSRPRSGRGRRRW
jgi:hypothetical protein